MCSDLEAPMHGPLLFEAHTMPVYQLTNCNFVDIPDQKCILSPTLNQRVGSADARPITKIRSGRGKHFVTNSRRRYHRTDTSTRISR